MGKINITNLDQRTVKDLDRAIEVLNNKLQKGNLSSTARKTTEKQIEKYKNQIQKTKSLYRKYKNKTVIGPNTGKAKTLKEFSVYALSVKTIYEKIKGVDSINKSHVDKNSFKQWFYEHQSTNTVALGAAGIALTSLVVQGIARTDWATVGPKMLESLGAAGNSFVKTFGVKGSVGLGGGIAIAGGLTLAGIIAGRVIYKKYKEHQAAKEEAEEQLTKDTAQDREAVAKTGKNSKLLNQFIADAIADEEILENLKAFCTDSSNSPETIIQARKIVQAAELQIKINKAQAQEALFTSRILADDNTCKLIEQYETLEKIKELYDDYQENIKDITEFTHTNLDSNSTKGKISDLIKAKNKMKGGNLDDAKKLIGKMSKDDFVKDIIGENQSTHGISNYDSCKTEVESFYDKANKILQDEKVTDANQKLSQIKKEGESSGEFELNIENGTLGFNDRDEDEIDLSKPVDKSDLFSERNAAIAHQCDPKIEDDKISDFCFKNENIIKKINEEIQTEKAAVRNAGMNN